MSAKKLTKPQLITEIQSAMPEAPSKAAIEALLNALAAVCQKNTKAGLVVEVPGVVRLKTVEKAASPEKQKMNYFTKKMITVAAKPASKKVKATPAKALKEAVA